MEVRERVKRWCRVDLERARADLERMWDTGGMRERRGVRRRSDEYRG